MFVKKFPDYWLRIVLTAIPASELSNFGDRLFDGLVVELTDRVHLSSSASSKER